MPRASEPWLNRHRFSRRANPSCARRRSDGLEPKSECAAGQWLRFGPHLQLETLGRSTPWLVQQQQNQDFSENMELRPDTLSPCSTKMPCPIPTHPPPFSATAAGADAHVARILHGGDAPPVSIGILARH